MYQLEVNKFTKSGRTIALVPRKYTDPRHIFGSFKELKTLGDLFCDNMLSKPIARRFLQTKIRPTLKGVISVEATQYITEKIWESILITAQ